MKVFSIVVFLISSASAFQPSAEVSRSSVKLCMSSVDKKKKGNASFLDDFFSHPFHAQGSSHSNSELEGMYEVQKQVLEARKKDGISRDKLKRKYSRINEDHLKDIPLHKHDPALLNQKEDDAMYVDEDGPTFEIPFLKNLNKLKP